MAGAIRLRVRYCECDPMGVAHHASYVPWLEMGRTELLRETGVSYAQLESAGVFLVIVKLEVRYRRAVLYDDIVEIRTNVVRGSRVKIEHEYDVVLIERGQGRLKDAGAVAGDVLAVAATTLACVSEGGRPVALPEWLVGPRPGDA
jgi:acyl-CoA thioester hydrolase